jgi:L-gulonolactone oxidase
MSNLGSITWQSITGALSTGTHGTGINLGILATFVRELELINAQGQVLRCSAVQSHAQQHHFQACFF